MTTQPIAAREVADALVVLALGDPVGRTPDIAGPEQRQQWLATDGSHDASRSTDGR